MLGDVTGRLTLESSDGSIPSNLKGKRGEWYEDHEEYLMVNLMNYSRSFLR